MAANDFTYDNPQKKDVYLASGGEPANTIPAAYTLPSGGTSSIPLPPVSKPAEPIAPVINRAPFAPPQPAKNRLQQETRGLPLGPNAERPGGTKYEQRLAQMRAQGSDMTPMQQKAQLQSSDKAMDRASREKIAGINNTSRESIADKNIAVKDRSQKDQEQWHAKRAQERQTVHDETAREFKASGKDVNSPEFDKVQAEKLHAKAAEQQDKGQWQEALETQKDAHALEVKHYKAQLKQAEDSKTKNTVYEYDNKGVMQGQKETIREGRVPEVPKAESAPREDGKERINVADKHEQDKYTQFESLVKNPQTERHDRIFMQDWLKRYKEDALALGRQ